MTVKELKEMLENYEDDLEVVVQYRDGGGDYSGADKYLFLCRAAVLGDGFDSYTQVVYGEDADALMGGKKVLVL